MQIKDMIKDKSSSRTLVPLADPARKASEILKDLGHDTSGVKYLRRSAPAPKWPPNPPLLSCHPADIE